MQANEGDRRPSKSVFALNGSHAENPDLEPLNLQWEGNTSQAFSMHLVQCICSLLVVLQKTGQEATRLQAIASRVEAIATSNNANKLIVSSLTHLD